MTEKTTEVMPVDATDLEAVWKVLNEAGQQRATSTDVLESVCKSGADIEATAYRAQMLLLVGHLASNRGITLKPEKLFSVGAEIPMGRMAVGEVQNLPFDVDELFRRCS
jgi:hypothetical protein